MDNDKNSNGAIVGLIIILIVLIIGGVYIWQTHEKKVKEIEQQNAALSAADAAALDSLGLDVGTVDSGVNLDVTKVD